MSTVGAIGNDWESIIQEQILLGWENQKDSYLQLLTGIDTINVAQEEKKCGGMAAVYGIYYSTARRNYSEAILPLCWEAVLKFDGYWPGWKIMIFLYMLRAYPTEDSIAPVFHLLTTTHDREVRHESSEVLAKLPKDAVKARLPALIEKHKEILYLLDTLQKK